MPAKPNTLDISEKATVIRNAAHQFVNPENVATKGARLGIENSPRRTQGRGPMPMEKNRMKTKRHKIGIQPKEVLSLIWK